MKLNPDSIELNPYFVCAFFAGLVEEKDPELETRFLLFFS